MKRLSALLVAALINVLPIGGVQATTSKMSEGPEDQQVSLSAFPGTASTGIDVLYASSESGNIGELTSDAEAIIIGTVTGKESYWNAERTEIYTTVAVATEESLKGNIQGPANTTFRGGEADGIGQFVSNMPSFSVGQRYCLFLRSIPASRAAQIPATRSSAQFQHFETVGGYKGNLPVSNDRVAGLAVTELKSRIQRLTSGEVLSPQELSVPVERTTAPYLASGYSWPHPPAPVVTFRINENTPDCTGEATSIQAAATTWNGAGAYFTFSYSGTSATIVAGRDGINTISWTDMGSGPTLAVTSTYYYVSNNTIFENDMEFNEYYSWSTAATPPSGQYDVQTVALHEFGHYLNLADLYNSADSAKVMYGYCASGNTKRALHSDDMAGIQNIYGAKPVAPSVTNSSGAGSVTQTAARLNGQIDSTGGENPTVHIYWGTTDGGTTATSWAHDIALGARGAGSFYSDVSGLPIGTWHYYRVYASNSGGGSWASSTSSFRTLAALPSLTNGGGASAVTATSAKLNGNLVSTGGENPAVHICWGQSDGGTTPGNWAHDVNLGSRPTGAFSTDITALPISTTHYYRCYAVNSAGTSWAPATEQFLTVTPESPTFSDITTDDGNYFSDTPTVRGLGFEDAEGLDDGWWQMDSYTGTWNQLFSNTTSASWSANWTIPSSTFSGLSQGSHVVYFRVSNDFQLFGGETGEWHWQFFKDTVAPSAPSGLNANPAIKSWSSDNTVDINWIAATDASGISGYSTVWDTSPATDPAGSTNSDNSTSVTSPELVSGNSIYFHILAIDLAGNPGPAAHLGPFYIDTIAPVGPSSANSTSHTRNTWYQNNVVTANWTAAGDTLSGLAGYSTWWGDLDTADPNPGVTTDNGTRTWTAQAPDGDDVYFHVRAVDAAGNWGSILTFGPFLFDTTGPDSPVVGAATPAPNTWSNVNSVTVNWSQATDGGIGPDGYSYSWDHSPSTIPVPTRSLADNLTSMTNPVTADGIYYFHIRPVDELDNWGSPSHIGPFLIDITPPAGTIAPSSTSHSAGIWSNNPAISLRWTAANDAASGIAGYSVLWNNVSGSDAPQSMNTANVTSLVSQSLSDSPAIYAHVRAVDRAGNWAAVTEHAGPFSIDTVAPTGPSNLISASHTAGAWSTNSTVSVNWTAALDAASGLDGYSTLWDTSPNTTPASTRNTPATAASANATLTDGVSHYFHVRAKDIAGNWGTTATVGPFLIDVDSPALSAGAVSPASGYANTTFTYSVSYYHPQGLAAASVSLKVDDDPASNMIRNPGQSANYTQGQMYSCNITGLAPGNHLFVFSASDNCSPAHPALQVVSEYFGPAVQNVPVQPPSGGSGFGGLGGGGGGGGGAEPGSFALGPYTNDEGLFNIDATIRSDDNNAVIEIPKGVRALTAAGTALKGIKLANSSNLPAAAIGSKSIGSPYQCGPEGAKFDPAISLTLTYDPATMPADIDIDSLTIAVLNEQSATWEPLGSSHNKSAHSLTTLLSHFSNYAIIGKVKVSQPPPPARAPASFTVSDVTTDISKVVIGQAFTISAKASNTGETEGTLELYLKLNGIQKQTSSVVLAPGSSKIVTFTVTVEESGSYQVEVNGAVMSFMVDLAVRKESVEPTIQPVATPSPKSGGSSAVGITALVGAVLLAGLGIGFIVARRHLSRHLRPQGK